MKKVVRARSAALPPRANDPWVGFGHKLKDLSHAVHALIARGASGGTMPADGKALAMVCGRGRKR